MLCHVIYVKYEVFFNWSAYCWCCQGDLEKAQGKTPIAMKDRNTAHELPAHQVRNGTELTLNQTEGQLDHE